MLFIFHGWKILDSVTPPYSYYHVLDSNLLGRVKIHVQRWINLHVSSISHLITN